MAHEDETEDWSELVSFSNLKREISLELYVEDQLSELRGLNSQSTIDNSRERLDEFVRNVAQYAQPGDCWWEWVIGTEPLRQMGGLAVVRNGTIVWATMTWIS